MASGTVVRQGHEALVNGYGVMQRRAAAATLRRISSLWVQLDTADLSGSWTAGLGTAMVRALSAGQLLAASSGQPYVDAMVAADELSSDYMEGATRVNASALSGVASDGRALDSLLYLPLIRTKTLLGGGMSLSEAMLSGWASMQRMVLSEVADAGNSSSGLAMVANRTVTGYVRCIRAGACARCAILAGRWYRYDAGFQRHKRCACYGAPATDARRGRLTSANSFFNSLSSAEQNRRFTVSGAQAIRDGADLNQIVNSRRGITTIGSSVDEQGLTHRGSSPFTDVYGRRVQVTSEGTTRRGSYYQQARADAEARLGTRFARGGADLEQGLPSFRLRAPRLTPGEIYRLTEDRDELIRLLKRFGYLL